MKQKCTLQGQCALVTGESRGIGRAIALRMADFVVGHVLVVDGGYSIRA